MPGRIVAVRVKAGDRVAKGQPLVILEAMKMEHTLTAPFQGTVTAISAAEGNQVSEGVVLARIDASRDVSAPRSPRSDAHRTINATSATTSSTAFTAR